MRTSESWVWLYAGWPPSGSMSASAQRVLFESQEDWVRCWTQCGGRYALVRYAPRREPATVALLYRKSGQTRTAEPRRHEKGTNVSASPPCIVIAVIHSSNVFCLLNSGVIIAFRRAHTPAPRHLSVYPIFLSIRKYRSTSARLCPESSDLLSVVQLQLFQTRCVHMSPQLLKLILGKRNRHICTKCSPRVGRLDEFDSTIYYGVKVLLRVKLVTHCLKPKLSATGNRGDQMNDSQRLRERLQSYMTSST